MSLKYTNVLAYVFVCCQQYSNISEKASQIKATCHVEPFLERGEREFVNGPGLLTKMAAMSING